MRARSRALLLAFTLSVLPPDLASAQIRIVAWEAGSEYRTAEIVARLISERTKLGKAVLLSASTPVEGVRRVVEGKADLTVVRGDVAYTAWAGTTVSPSGAPLWALVSLDTVAVQVVAIGKQDLAALKGMKVAVSPDDSAAGQVARSVLTAEGLQGDVRLVPTSEPWRALERGGADAAILFATLGDPAIRKPIREAGARVVSLSPTTIAALKRSSPYLREYTIPPTVYGVQAATTVATVNVLISKLSLPDDAAYQITAAYASSLSELGKNTRFDFATHAQGSFKFVDLAADIGTLAWTPFGFVRAESKPPGAAIVADGSFKGLMTDETFHLTVGEHTCTLLLNDYERVDRKVIVYDRKRAECKATLKKSPGTRHQLPPMQRSEAVVRAGNLPVPLHPGAARFLQDAKGPRRNKWTRSYRVADRVGRIV
ncbi:MAG: TAXI family TRAP transporter solute-binding subunit [Candidatus Rokuibacteriota bacterium]